MTVDDARRAASTQIFVAPEILDAEAHVELDGETEHHLGRVLRLRSGEQVSVSDGVGRWRLAAAVRDGNALRLEPISPVYVTDRDGPELTLVTAIPKGDRVDWLVQKTVEIGIDTIQFVHAEHSVVRWKPERAAKQIDRLSRIALEAARQSRRVWLPRVVAPVGAASALLECVVAEPGGRAVGAGDTSVAVGPEGGWSKAELEMSSDQVELGSNVLRTETAGVVATTLCVAACH